mmetsp:Transcript_9965/g.13142  ORF Transcript_9965/g.13142 Transcript_9965/m.13142 type:complete len:123 (+) Transcript_9965:130-498(+)
MIGSRCYYHLGSSSSSWSMLAARVLTMTTIATLSVGSSKMSFTAAAAAVDNVPARMQLSRSIKQALTSSSSSPSLYEAPLIPLTLNNKESLVREEQDDIQSLQQVALQQKGPSVAFILRRPG